MLSDGFRSWFCSSFGMQSRLQETIGYVSSETEAGPARERLEELANVKLASRGFSVPESAGDSPLLTLGRSLLANFEEKLRLFGEPLCPVDQAIHDFLARVFSLPADAGQLERHVADLSSFLERRTRLQPAERAAMEEKLQHAREQLLDLEKTGAQRYAGSLGLDPALLETEL